MRTGKDGMVGMVFILPLLTTLVGCANTLAFGTATKFGLDISQRPDQVIDVTLGYDRVEVASIPAPKDADATLSEDTYSVLGFFVMRFGNPWPLPASQPLRLNQFFATGMAAQKAAKNPQLQEFFGKIAADIAKKELQQ